MRHRAACFDAMTGVHLRPVFLQVRRNALYDSRVSPNEENPRAYAGGMYGVATILAIPRINRRSRGGFRSVSVFR